MQREIIKQCSQFNFRLYDTFPKGAAKEMIRACDKFFESRNITYGNSWFHEQKRDKDNRTKEK